MCWNCNSKGHQKANCSFPVKQEEKAKQDLSAPKGSSGESNSCGPSNSMKLNTQRDKGPKAGHTSAEKEDNVYWVALFSANEMDRHLSDRPIAAHPLLASHAHTTHPILYNSGASHHMSLDHTHFVDYCTIELQDIRIANNDTIHAVSAGDMVILVPNKGSNLQIQLINVLYLPKLGFTLVSIISIDDTGYSTTFIDGYCKIYNDYKEAMACFPKKQMLYAVVNITNQIATAGSITPARLTIMELHHQMGHISFRVTHHLVTEGQIKGIQLIDSDENIYCESVYMLRPSERCSCMRW